MIITQQKLVISGKIVTHYCFDRALVFLESHDSGYGVIRSRKSSSRGGVVSSANRFKSAFRARRRFFDLVCANFRLWFDVNGRSYMPVFYTFTFRDVKDLDYCHNEFKNFVKRFNYKFGIDLMYVAVMEWQKRGALHYHMIWFNTPFIPYKAIDPLWPHGSATIKGIKGDVGMANYLIKYFVKSYKDVRLDNRKRYFSSRGLLKPQIEFNERDIDYLLSSCSKRELKRDSYDSSYLGNVSVVQYELLNYRQN